MLMKLIRNVLMLIFGLILPVFWSHKAIENNDNEELKKWLAHCITYMLFMQASYVTDILFGAWLPFYNEILVMIYLWLIHPGYNGGTKLYEEHLKPFLMEHEPTTVLSVLNAGKKVIRPGMEMSFRITELAKGYSPW